MADFLNPNPNLITCPRLLMAETWDLKMKPAANFPVSGLPLLACMPQPPTAIR
jgi:hypothetical protein